MRGLTAGKIVLEKSRRGATVSVLPDEKPQPDQHSREFRTVSENPLAAAVAYIGRDAQTTGEESFGLRQKAAIAQRAALIEWAAANELKLTPEIWAGKLVTGASEHDVWVQNGEYWKVTRPDHFGWTVLPGENGIPESAEATPLEYLQRWQNANLHLGDSAQLRGIVQTEQGVQVVISHPYVDGPYPSPEAIVRDMGKRGFSQVPRFFMGANAPSFYHEAANIAVFDASEDNFILSGGVPVPVDVITLIPESKLRAQLHRLLRGF